MRYLAIDLGDRRTGLATGDDESGIVSAAGVIELPLNRGDSLLDGLCQAIRDHEPEELVVGMPFNMDGSEGPRAKLVRVFVERLTQRIDLPVRYQDERPDLGAGRLGDGAVGDDAQAEEAAPRCPRRRGDPA